MDYKLVVHLQKFTKNDLIKIERFLTGKCIIVSYNVCITKFRKVELAYHILSVINCLTKLKIDNKFVRKDIRRFIKRKILMAKFICLNPKFCMKDLEKKYYEILSPHNHDSVSTIIDNKLFTPKYFADFFNIKEYHALLNKMKNYFPKESTRIYSPALSVGNTKKKISEPVYFDTGRYYGNPENFMILLIKYQNKIQKIMEILEYFVPRDISIIIMGYYKNSGY